MKSGFSLIEILVVIIIISILASVVTVNIMDKPDEARIAQTKAQVRELQTALQMYKTEQGNYPTQAQGLAALATSPIIPPLPARYPSHGYLSNRSIPKDGWKNEFVYLIPGRAGERYEILSYGADGEPGGEAVDADISSADL